MWNDVVALVLKDAPVARSLNAPTTRMIGGSSPTRSNAMLVPSLERTMSMGPPLPVETLRFDTAYGSSPETQPAGFVAFHNGNF